MDKYANNPIESDHSRLKSRLRPMRGLKRLRCARVISAGHAFIQNLRRAVTTNSGPRNPRCCGWRLPSTSWPWRSDQPGSTISPAPASHNATAPRYRYHALMATGAKPPSGAMRRWARLLVAVGAGLSAMAGATINFGEAPTLLRSAAVISLAFLTTALAWQSQSPAPLKKMLAKCHLPCCREQDARCRGDRWPSGFWRSGRLLRVCGCWHALGRASSTCWACPVL
jgi:DDE domain